MSKQPCHTPFFRDFHRVLFGRAPRLCAKFLKWRGELGEAAIARLESMFGRCIPSGLLDIDRGAGGVGKNSRVCLLSPAVTFWGFLSQVLSPGGSCREAFARIQAFCSPLGRGCPRGDETTYCKARSRLDEGVLREILRHSATRLESGAPDGGRWKGHRTLLADATTASMPDTAANQARWPQSTSQAAGCGFPNVQIVGLFSLGTCALADFAEGAQDTHESDLLYTLRHNLGDGDLLLGDRLYGSYVNISWVTARGAEVLMRKNGRRGPGREIRRLGENDRVVSWAKPHSRSAHPGLTGRLWEELPAQMEVREITFHVHRKGSRTRKVTIVTTLLDPVRYPAAELAELYCKRWNIEMWFDDIKTSMGMDVLRCKSPGMVTKEILVNLIAYNMVRTVMGEAAAAYHRGPGEISFKGTLDRIGQWGPVIAAAASGKKRRELYLEMLRGIACDPVRKRPGRYEPRLVKRRAKAYGALKKPRQEYRDEFAQIPHQEPASAAVE